MLPVVLADSLWWMAARLRRILTGLLVLGLAIGATATGPAAMVTARSAPPTGGTSQAAATSLVTAASSSGESRPGDRSGESRPGDRPGDWTGGQLGGRDGTGGPIPTRVVSDAGLGGHVEAPEPASIRWDGESDSTPGWAAERPSAAGTHRTLLLPEPAAGQPALGPDERPRSGRHAAPYGQRAPPTA